ncbi:hypothetical protein ILUMI_25709 [Ignelater luminosus]|uniref:Uncharacterized protein n=1 Tax=Ignelater luminosus TaxID=2038154 RepID=A0A8K0C7W8_IGNLU|nr:hypothetical protein ILUMI_25709 [Ignelater luminosus]
MSQNLMEFGEKSEKYPNVAEFYIKLKKDKETYLEDLKKLYNNVLQINFSYVCLKLQSNSLIATSEAFHTVLDYDSKEETQVEDVTSNTFEDLLTTYR